MPWRKGIFINIDAAFNLKDLTNGSNSNPDVDSALTKKLGLDSIKLFNKAAKETNAVIIIISSIANSLKTDELEEILIANGAEFKVLDRIKITDVDHETEILKWLDANHFVVDFAIIDNEKNIRLLQSRLIQIDEKNELQEKHVVEIAKKLRGEIHFKK